MTAKREQRSTDGIDNDKIWLVWRRLEGPKWALEAADKFPGLSDSGEVFGLLVSGVRRVLANLGERWDSEQGNCEG